MICSSPALEPFYWMPPCHLVTPALEWDTQSFYFFTLCLFTTEVVSKLQPIMKPNGQRKTAGRHIGASPRIKILVQNIQPCFQTSWKWYFTIVHLFSFSNFAFPHFCFRCYLHVSLSVHIFLETWLLDCDQTFFSSPT